VKRSGRDFYSSCLTLYSQVTQLGQYSFNPIHGIEDLPINIQLSAAPNPFSCASMYPLKEVVVEGSKITLRYIHELDPLIDCIQIDDMLIEFGPNFEVPSLQPGVYEIVRNETYTCLQNIPACLIPEQIELLGNLTISAEGNTDASFWYLDPVNPEPGTAFDLQLLNPNKGSCNDYYTDSSILQQNGYISTSFVSRVHDPILYCIVDTHPSGPQFNAAGMSKGDYNVFITEWPPCAFCLPDQEPCFVCDIFVMPAYLGKITVGQVVPAQGNKKESFNRFEIEVTRNSGGLMISGLPAEWLMESVSLLNSLGKSVPVQIHTADAGALQINFLKSPSRGIYHLVFGSNNNSRVLALPINGSD